MALRRLLSGWLIAMAALARSVAQALERASEDRSQLAPDPVMDALAERYPGAPAHWLAHVAQRTVELANAGEAPLSLNSDPTAWPVRPDSLTPLATPPLPERPPVVREPAPARRDAVVPTLAALRDRSSEVWRRPDDAPRRRPRPVFAASEPAPMRPARAVSTSGAARRPRVTLTVVSAPSQAAPIASEGTAPAPSVSSTERSPLGTAWSQAPAPPSSKAQPTAPGPAETPPAGHVFSPAPVIDPGKARLETNPERVDPSSVARRRKPWFFARPRPSTAPKRRRAGDEAEAVEVDPVSTPRAAFTVSTSDPHAVSPEPARSNRTPSTARRSIFRSLAGLGAGRPRRVERFRVSGPVVSKAGPSIDAALSELGTNRPASSFAPSPLRSSPRAAVGFPRFGLAAPARATEDPKFQTLVDPLARWPSSAWSPNREPDSADKRPTYATSRQTPSRRSHFAEVSPDDRWPALPPSTFAPPLAVEAPTPRWDQLAREQEEGRWSV